VSSNRTAVAPLALLDSMSKSKRLRNVRAESPSIAGRIRGIYSESHFQELLQPIQWVPERPIAEVASAIAQTFSHTHHFTILHAVTSCHAFRLLLPYIDDVGKAIGEYWHAICAAYLTVVNESPAGQGRTPEAGDRWQAVFEKATATPMDDVVRFEHTVKLVYTCFKEWEFYNRDIYRALAVREVDTASVRPPDRPAT
jgi:hypothetical protein